MGIKHWIGQSFFDFAYGIIYREREEMLLCDLETGSDNEVFHLLKPSFRFWYADPVALRFQEEDYVLCEVYDRIKQKGVIGACLYKNGKLKKPRIILEEPFHLSFPSTFCLGKETFLIPECSEIGQIRIYQLTDGLTPKLVRNFNLNEPCVDTVVFVKQNKVYFLTCIINKTNPKKTRLRLFVTENIFDGELKEIVLDNKLREDSYFIRNGGPILEAQKGWIRILQESTETEYGHNLIIRYIKNLSEEGLIEEKGRLITIDDYHMKWPLTYRKQGTHTYGFNRKLEVADISFNRFHLGNFWMK